HLLRVQAEPDDLGGGEIAGEMAAPAAHEIEQPAAAREDVGVETAESGDGAVVDVDHLARWSVELRVGRLVVPRVRGGGEEPVARNVGRAQRRGTVPVSMSIASRRGPSVCMASKPCSTMSQ